MMVASEASGDDGRLGNAPKLSTQLTNVCDWCETGEPPGWVEAVDMGNEAAPMTRAMLGSGSGSGRGRAAVTSFCLSRSGAIESPGSGTLALST